MNSAFWFAAGLVVGLEIGIALAWWSLRRINRSSGTPDRVQPYVGERRWPW